MYAKAAGPDAIQPVVLRSLKDQVDPILQPLSPLTVPRSQEYPENGAWYLFGGLQVSKSNFLKEKHTSLTGTVPNNRSIKATNM